MICSIFREDCHVDYLQREKGRSQNLLQRAGWSTARPSLHLGALDPRPLQAEAGGQIGGVRQHLRDNPAKLLFWPCSWGNGSKTV